MSRQLALVAAAAAALSSVWAPCPASARQWKPTPEAIARDYALIEDTRAGAESVFIAWFVPTMLQPNLPAGNPAAAFLQNYVVIVATHGQLDRTTLAITFEDINALEAMDQDGKVLAPIARDSLPPSGIGMLSILEGIFRQALGAMGKGMKVFVFNGNGVDSCKKGQLSIPFVNETYTWDTPFPGCPESRDSKER